ncbi:hypothetical protein [Bacillus nitratireducens]|uniref:hypothetical protein n=1 Tax=Bacillus nitratireducens TaxID=2026193 RepID=UPI002E1A94E7|nr:hypothetical protein [Bacillus nitratireducens]
MKVKKDFIFRCNYFAIYEKEFLAIKKQKSAPDYFFEMEDRKAQFHRKEDIDE